MILNLFKRFLFLATASLAFVASLKAQSTANNYILTYTPRTPITNASTLPGNTVSNVNQTVQYFDGLGRPIQTIQTKASPSQRDIIQPIAYDQYSREAIKYLPYVDSAASTNYGTYRTTALTDQASFYANPANSKWNAPGVVSTPFPISATSFEASPLNRTLEQGFAGDNWQLTGTVGATSPGHTVKMLYASNDASSLTSGDGYWAQLYTVVFSYPSGQYNYRNSLANSGAYPVNTLYVTVVKNENWSKTQSDTTLNTTQEYKDLFGRVVLKRTVNYNTVTSTREVLSTYYVYDEYNNLVYVLPPAAKPDNGGITQAQLDNLCYQYRYDGRNRVIYKKIPGKGWEFMIYNNLDQVIATQDSVQRMGNPQQVSYSKYDSQGRVIITGIYTISGSSPGTDYRSTLQTNANAETTLWETKSTSGVYSTVTIPTSGATIYTTNYYDDYNISGLPAKYTLTSGVSVMTRGLLTATETDVLNTPADLLWSVNYYDDLGRNINSYAQHYLGGHSGYSINNYDVASTTYNFANQPTTLTRRHWNSTGTTYPLVTIYNRYRYDHVGRTLNSWEQLTNGSNTPDTLRLLANLTYNQIGQVAYKNLHSTDSVHYLQTISYFYNERGWLYQASAPLFNMVLYYNAGANKAWNGNIMYQYWGVPGNLTNNYVYTYDNLNRLTSGITTADNYQESGINYDLNGNITALNRYQAGSKIDQLSYYYNSKNRQDSIQDANSSNAGLVSGTTKYTWDGNGNMLGAANTVNMQQNKSFTYNLLNLPIVATVPTGTATYYYDAAGNKLRKVDVLGGATTTTDYIKGIQYNGTSAADTLSFIQTAEGKAVHNGTTYDYQYYLGDNLGNTRITFNTKTGTAYVVQKDDYYPFGMEILRAGPHDVKNEYLYNKKELQEEFNEYDYGARFYDPVIGRWQVVDKYAEHPDQINLSPYVYVADNPVDKTDPDGNCPPCFISFVPLLSKIVKTVENLSGIKADLTVSAGLQARASVGPAGKVDVNLTSVDVVKLSARMDKGKITEAKRTVFSKTTDLKTGKTTVDPHGIVVKQSIGVEPLQTGFSGQLSQQINSNFTSSTGRETVEAKLFGATTQAVTNAQTGKTAYTNTWSLDFGVALGVGIDLHIEIPRK